MSISIHASPFLAGFILNGTRPAKLFVVASSDRRPISRLTAKIVFSGLVTACLFAACPTTRSSSSRKATIDGVVLPPSAFSITLGALPSITATQEFVVPKSIPITRPIFLFL